MDKIAVSIIIPVYNADRYLHQCIKSICNQSLQEWELICIDDHSTDQSMKILRNCERKDNRVHVYSNEGTPGAGGGT